MKNFKVFASLSLGLIFILSGCAKEHLTGVPDCVNKLIMEMQAEPVSNPPGSVWQYQYKGKTVYFIPARCCDIPSRLLSSDCSLICNPDGGFSGAGDGKCKDFFSERTEEKLVWQDKRK